MIILRQKNYNAFDNVGNSTNASQVVANKKKVNLNAGLVRLGKKFNQFKTNRKLNQVQKMVNKGKINSAEGSLLAGNIMESYHNKNQQILNKRKAKVGRPINTNPAPIGSSLEAISSTNNTRKNNTNTQQQNNGQGTSILSNLKNTWGGMTSTQKKNVARGAAGLLAIGATAATVNAIKNRQRRKEEEDARRGGRRGGVVVF